MISKDQSTHPMQEARLHDKQRPSQTTPRSQCIEPRVKYMINLSQTTTIDYSHHEGPPAHTYIWERDQTNAPEPSQEPSVYKAINTQETSG